MSIDALSGCRALDLTDEKGMLCARLLADMGARAVRVESPDTEVASRSTVDFCYRNAGKLSITLDLGREEGRALFKRLVTSADFLVESYPPGYLDSLGIGYRDLSRLNPGLIMASITDFGQTGPYRDLASCNLVTSALGGHVSVNGAPDTSPLKPAGDQAYSSACIFGAIGVMLALWHRHETGRGQHIDVSAMECAAATLDQVLVRHFYEGVVSKRLGGEQWNGAFRVFRCRDGYVLLSLFQNWETLVEWLASEGMAADLDDGRWLDTEYRHDHADHIAEVLERWTLTHSADDLVERGQLMRFPWAPVNSPKDVLESQQLAARGFFHPMDCGGKAVAFPGGKAGASIPRPGEHNVLIYQGEMGLSSTEMQTLHKAGII